MHLLTFIFDRYLSRYNRVIIFLTVSWRFKVFGLVIFQDFTGTLSFNGFLTRLLLMNGHFLGDHWFLLGINNLKT